MIEKNIWLDRKYICQRYENPTIDSHEYAVQYPDSTKYMLKYSKVIDHIYSQIDDSGDHIHIYAVIVGHQERNFLVEKTN